MRITSRTANTSRTTSPATGVHINASAVFSRMVDCNNAQTNRYHVSGFEASASSGIIDLANIPVNEIDSAYIRSMGVYIQSCIKTYCNHYQALGVVAYQDDDVIADINGSVKVHYRTFVELDDRSFLLEIISSNNLDEHFNLIGCITAFENVDEEVFACSLFDLDERKFDIFMKDGLHIFLHKLA
jgi:hypothetical protein